MKTDYNYITRRFASLNNESLIKILTEDFDEYEEEALQAARQELENRKINLSEHLDHEKFQFMIEHEHIAPIDMIPLCNVLSGVDYALVESALFDVSQADTELMKRYRRFYSTLLGMEPICADVDDTNRNISIIIEKQMLEADDENMEIWEVSGLDTKTGERLNIELFGWASWLSFYVNKKDLDKLGVENYIAHCLNKMTINGFDEDEIEDNLKKKMIPSNVNIQDMTSQNVFAAAKEFIENQPDIETSQVRPWVRYFARSIDSAWLLVIVSTALAFLLPRGHVLQSLSYLIYPLISILLETLLLSRFGTTPGKWFFNIRVTGDAGEKPEIRKALYRSFGVWFFGNALNINMILNSFASVVSYFRLTRMGKTYWDEKSGCTVVHEKLNIVKCMTGIILTTVLFYIWAFEFTPILKK